MYAGFVARECGLGLTRRVMVQVRDKVLLSKLATVLQQMDSSIFSSPEAVQEVSVILNAYAGSKMNDVALVLSQTLTNHLKPYIGGVTAQVTLTHSLAFRALQQHSTTPHWRYPN
jgi:hypothetical protein